MVVLRKASQGSNAIAMPLRGGRLTPWRKHLTRLDQLKRALDAGLIDRDTFDTAAAAINAQLSGSGAIAQGQESLWARAAWASQATTTGISAPASSPTQGTKPGASRADLRRA